MPILKRLADLFRHASGRPTQPAATTTTARDLPLYLALDPIYEHAYSLGYYPHEAYVGENNALSLLVTKDGQLFRLPVRVENDVVYTGDPEPVRINFTPRQRTVVRLRDDGRYEGWAILCTAALNKDLEIDTRSLFDTLVERFQGGGYEYVNLYHLGNEEDEAGNVTESKTRIGELTYIFREGNLLVGHLLFDDNRVARAAAETMAADEDGLWGGSIEYYPDAGAEQMIELAPGIEVKAIFAGTLRGYSITKAEHGCAWLTANRITKTRRRMMNQIVEGALTELLGGDQDALAELRTWLDSANERLSDAITRTSAEAMAESAEATGAPEMNTEGEQSDENVPEETEDAGAVVDEAQIDAGAIERITARLEAVEAIFAAQEQLAASIAALTEQNAALSAQLAELAGTPQEIEIGDETAAAMRSALGVDALAGQVTELTTALATERTDREALATTLRGEVAGYDSAIQERLTRLERGDSERLQELDEGRPVGRRATVTWRAPRGDSEPDPNKPRSVVAATDELLAELDKTW